VRYLSWSFKPFYLSLNMSFWEKSGYTFQTFAELSDVKIMLLINILTREDLIEWLCWNDANGIYRDEQSLKELGNVMTCEEGLEIVLRQVEENRVAL
jgi:hypothetical protein